MQESGVVTAARAAAGAGQNERAWQLFTQFQQDVATSREAALAFAELLGSDPHYPDALNVAERIVGGFGSDPGVIIALSASLLRVAELRPADEPPFEKGPAHLAAGACQRSFEQLDGKARMDPELGGYLQINLADALRMMGPEHDEDALNAYKVALAIDDARGAWWFNLGLLHKWRGRFREGLAANQKAYARLGPERRVLWNLAICATALGEGQLALEAWAKAGIQGELSSAGMPYVPDMPPMQIRVATLGEDTGQGDPLPAQAVTFEVVWVQPLSPCHGVVQSPTARRASVDYGDVVLWDGAPVRIHRMGGREVPVFPLLWILRPGDERRLRFVGMEKERGAIEKLALGDDTQLVVFDRRSTPAGDTHLFYGKLIVPGTRDLNEVRRALEAGLRTKAGLTLSVPQLYELLGDTPQAGKAHQAWGGIERAAEKQGLLPVRDKR
ncbi:MAG TPA: tetratricopeptide repeat protein [Polyangiales bacterium]